MFKFSFSSPPCLRDWVWIIGSWRKRWETWLIRRSPWLTGRPKSLRSSSGECSALMHYRNPSVCGGAAAEFFSLHMALGSAEVKPHTRLGFCWGFGWDFNNAQIQKIVFLLKSGSVSQNKAFQSAEESWPLGVALWLRKNAERNHVLSSRLWEGRSLGKVVAECLCLSINFLHLLGMWQNETNTVQPICDYFFTRSIWGYHKTSQCYGTFAK